MVREKEYRAYLAFCLSPVEITAGPLTLAVLQLFSKSVAGRETIKSTSTSLLPRNACSFTQLFLTAPCVSLQWRCHGPKRQLQYAAVLTIRKFFLTAVLSFPCCTLISLFLALFTSTCCGEWIIPLLFGMAKPNCMQPLTAHSPQ